MKPLNSHRARRRHPRRGVSAVEALVAVAVLLAGVTAVINYFPNSLRGAWEAAYLSEAALLAQRKAEEIRRDNDHASNLMNEIRARATPTDPLPFPEAPHLTYSFSGRSLLEPDDDPGTPRVIVRYSAARHSDRPAIYELKFQE